MTSETQEQSQMMAEPQKEHEWLQRLVGEWTYEGEVEMGPDQPPEKATGTETVRSVGRLWIVGEGQNQMPGSDDGTTRLTLGYDPQKKKFVGTWVGSMMANMWVYEGTLSGNKLTLDTEGPSMADDGTLANYREVIELKSDNERIFTSSVKGEDGQWTQFMTSTYRRR